MSAFGRWWRNENYDREHMRLFRESRPEWSEIPDETVAQTINFASFVVDKAFGELRRSIRKVWEGSAIGRRFR